MFFYERCEVTDDSKMKLSDLYNAYSRYCREEELPNKCGKKAFQDALKSFGAVFSNVHGYYYYNVKFKDLDSESADNPF